MYKRQEPHQLQRICTQAHDGFARVVVPAHTIGDGDIAFAVSMGTLEIPANDVLTVGALAARTVEAALLRSVMLAAGMKDMPSAADWRRR